MSRIFINKLDRIFNLELCKVNRDVVGIIQSTDIKSIYRSITDFNKIEFDISKYVYINGKKILNPIWYEAREERLVCVNGLEYFVLKSNSYNSNANTKSFTGYSLEYKLGKIDLNIESIGICLMDKDEENDIYSLNELLIDQTGWSFGHIDDSVRYDIDTYGKKTDKLRWQENISKKWYDFLKQDVSVGFDCVVTYDTLNKKINLYDINNFAENIELYLSNDNYIKSLQRTGSSEDIVTRLYLLGNEEMDIIGATTTGYPYIEDFSYFIDNDEMSDELKFALNKYNEMVTVRNATWKQLLDSKSSKNKSLNDKKNELFIIYKEIEAKKSIKKIYDANGDVVSSAIIAAEITTLMNTQAILEAEIKILEIDMVNIDSSIANINVLCKRETSTDENGKLIFNSSTLGELMEFVYCDTYSNDSFLDVNDLVKAGERELKIKSSPKIEYKLDLKSFVTRVKNNGFNKHWKGDLGLCDLIILFDEDLDCEIELFLNSYTQYPNAKDDENELDINISNKKITDNNLRMTGDRLKEASMANRNLNRKLHLLNKQKLNRINMSKEQINKGL